VGIPEASERKMFVDPICVAVPPVAAAETHGRAAGDALSQGAAEETRERIRDSMPASPGPSKNSRLLQNRDGVRPCQRKRSLSEKVIRKKYARCTCV
jgi:hypothetical protein